jgi:hypothetical protein
MAYGTVLNKTDAIGSKLIKYYTVTDVGTGGTNTITTGMRKIYHVSAVNTTRAAAGGLKVAVSGGTLTLTAENANDDFLLAVTGSR